MFIIWLGNNVLSADSNNYDRKLAGCAMIAIIYISLKGIVGLLRYFYSYRTFSLEESVVQWSNEKWRNRNGQP
jgi:hypothetical protein